MDALLIFDFDGVVADSEVLANAVLAEIITELGVPTTLQDSYDLYMGKRFPDVMAAIRTVVGDALPDTFADEYQARALARFQAELTAVQGARDYISAFAHVPKCIASSSPPDRLALCLGVLDLNAEFQPHVYSASLVPRGKPHPDIFLHAAAQVGVAPLRCVVIEDSPTGVQAGVAAGMTVIGLLAASHIQDGHRQRLMSAGAHRIADDFIQAEAITRTFLANLPAG
jgi:HAD superfamily hydrolase (TIGR01509 family)